MIAALDRTILPSILESFAQRAITAAEYFGNDIPDYFDVTDGRWRVNGGWTEGFWPGLLWEVFAASGHEKLREHARRTTRIVAHAQQATADHQLGFLFYPS